MKAATLGISPKVWAPVLLQVTALVAHFIATGEFDRVEASLAFSTAVTAIVGWYASPGYVDIDDDADHAGEAGVSEDVAAEHGLGDVR